MKTAILLCLVIASLSFQPGVPELTRLFHGTWTRLGTTYLFEFDLHLAHLEGNRVEGYFKWTFVRCNKGDALANQYYQDKKGLTAKEYVSGTWNPAERIYHLKGYQKDDPNEIIALDEYLLKVDENGDLSGDTKSHGTWLGRINAKAVELMDL